MANELMIIRAITEVCNCANSIKAAFQKYGYISSAQKAELEIKAAAAKRACISIQTEKLFIHNLDCIESATQYMAEKHFYGRTLTAVEEEYDIFINALKKNLADFVRSMEKL